MTFAVNFGEATPNEPAVSLVNAPVPVRSPFELVEDFVRERHPAFGMGMDVITGGLAVQLMRLGSMKEHVHACRQRRGAQRLPGLIRRRGVSGQCVKQHHQRTRFCAPVRKPLLEPQVGRSGQLPTTVRGEKHNVCLRRLGHSSVDQIQVGRVVLEITQISGDNGLRVPAELTILSKTLLNLDLVGQTLGPKFNPNASIRRNAEKILQQRVWKSFSQANLLGGLLEIRSKGNPQ